MMRMEDRSYRKLHWKIVATTLSFSLVPLFVVGFSIYYQFSVSYKAKVMESLRTLTENRANAVDLFLDERVSQLNTLVYTNSIDQLGDERYLTRVFTLLQMRSKSFVDVGIIDAEGNHVAYVGPYQLKGLNYRNEEWFGETMLRGIYISDVFTGFRKFPHFVIAIMRREGEKTWILRATINTDIFEAMVKAAQIGMKGDAFLMNKDNILQTSPRFGGELLGKVGYPIFPKFQGARVEETELGGEEALYGIVWLKDKQWLLVIKEDPLENLTPILRTRVLVIALVLGGVLVIVMGTLLVSNAVVRQLVKTDREKAALDAGLVQSSKMAALGKLAAGIAHEVNNPLAVIKEKVGWMKDLLSEEDVEASENFKEFDDAVKKIDYHVERARKVTHRLLGFARRMEPIQEQVTMNRVIEETVDFLKNEAHYRNIEIRTTLDPDMPTTTSDSSQLQQVFLNILNNAIDAIGKNGVITISTGYDLKNRELSVSIADDGPGIPSEVLGRVFDPFFTTKEVGKGTGLGLSISYSIVEKLGGTIKVASQVGKGTTFSIHLPIVNHATA
ncbi:integral membrane sensor signal transduction histidine kinase [Syntrophobacter fumaroxidans MPOB]|uniref:histidine kinase n=2 Tax=Syntrophobacter TaxID=29526 RepID=A0LFW4_SYNFM|nr:integral membrane sensor signal transduction histidine kinase [Syntrophobacter fumaroxidans MPOB]